jgi:hypothetical protein
MCDQYERVAAHRSATHVAPAHLPAERPQEMEVCESGGPHRAFETARGSAALLTARSLRLRWRTPVSAVQSAVIICVALLTMSGQACSIEPGRSPSSVPPARGMLPRCSFAGAIERGGGAQEHPNALQFPAQSLGGGCFPASAAAPDQLVEVGWNRPVAGTKRMRAASEDGTDSRVSVLSRHASEPMYTEKPCRKDSAVTSDEAAELNAMDWTLPSISGDAGRTLPSPSSSREPSPNPNELEWARGAAGSFAAAHGAAGAGSNAGPAMPPCPAAPQPAAQPARVEAPEGGASAGGVRQLQMVETPLPAEPADSWETASGERACSGCGAAHVAFGVPALEHAGAGGEAGGGRGEAWQRLFCAVCLSPPPSPSY